MKQNRTKKQTGIAAGLALALGLALLPFQSAAQVAGTQQTMDAQAALTEKQKLSVAEFEGRVKDYVKLREGVEGKLPKLSKDATPEQIEAHKVSFTEAVRAARTGAKHGDLFTSEIAAHIRALLRGEFKGLERKELRETLAEADTKAVPLRVNYAYPESDEFVEMPPTLLLKLPQLPKQVKYRMVRQHLLLVDRENGLIIDYLPDALGLGPIAKAASDHDTIPEGSKVGAPARPPFRITLPMKEGSVRFAVIGDTGTGTAQQYEMGRVLTQSREAYPFEFVLMLGDNLYKSEKAEDYKKKFEDVYRPLLDNKIKFYAALGNHDETNQRLYEHFNMNGEEYYRFTKGKVAFYALNSNYMDKKQVKWLEEQLAKDTNEWKIAFFHHPPYSSGGKHGSNTKLREVVEPIFLKYGVNVVLAGHEHFYERLRPQKGIYYFISGAGGKLREGDVKDNSPLTAKAYDKDLSFVLFEIVGDELHFQAISRTGETVDAGVMVNQRKKG